MLIYFLILTIPLIAHFFRFSIQGKKVENIVVTILAIFVCFGYMTGSDWRSYETMYNVIDLSDPMASVLVEPGYHIITVLFKFLGFDFWIFLIIAKLFCFFVAVRFIKRRLPEYIFFSLFVYLCLFGLFFYINNPLRNLITISLFLLFFDLMEQRRLKLYLLLVGLSMLIHLSAVFLFPIYFILNKRYSSRSIVILFIIINIVFSFSLDRVFSFIISLEDFLPFYAHKINAYFVEESKYIQGRMFSFGFITKIILFMLFMISRKELEDRFGILFFNGIVAYLIFYKIGLSITILSRFSFYFSLFYCIAIAYLVACFKEQTKLFYYLFIFMMSYFAVFVTITSSSYYIPYSNYVFYIFKQKPDYYYRSNYNLINSPYQNNDE